MSKGRYSDRTILIITLFTVGILVSSVLIATVIFPPSNPRDFESTGVYFHSGGNNAYFAMNKSIDFTNLKVAENYITFNNTRFTVESPNRINISIDKVNATMGGTQTLIAFYANTTGGTVYFNLSGFAPLQRYTVIRDSVLYIQPTADASGWLRFIETSWSEHYYEINGSSGLPPSHDTPILNSTTGLNYTSDDLTCYNQSTTDPDGDSVKNIYDWSVNGTSIAVLNMPFDGGSSHGYARDYANNNTIVNTQSLYFDATGGYDGFGAMQFNDTDSTLTIDDDPSLNITGNLTINLWMYPDSTVTSILLMKGDTADNYNYEFGHIGNDFYFGVGDGAGDWITSNQNEIVINNWMMATVVVRNGTDVRLYKDGINTFNGVLTNDVVEPCIGDLYIGNEMDGNHYFGGMMDDILIYDRALTPEQITLLYNNQTNKISYNETHVEERWQCYVTPVDTTNAAGLTKASNNVTIRNDPYWQVINDTYNGQFYNLSSWKVIDASYNGEIFNLSSWKIIDSTYNGQIYNLSSWKIIDNTYNGQIYNLSSWQIIDNTYNGQIYNVSSWQIIDNQYNGQIFNISSWQIIDNTYNGEIYNLSTWKIIDNQYNGEIYNTSESILPSVTLNSPLSQHYNTNDFVFNATSQDNAALSNVTLFIWWQSNNTIYQQNFTTISGTINTTLWNINNIPDGYYIWGCYVNDTNNNGDWSNTNHSFEIDTTLPNIPVIVSPTNYSNISDPTPDITFNLTDNQDNILDYKIFVDGIEVTDSGPGIVINGVEITITITTNIFGLGNHTITVQSMDNCSNKRNNTINITLVPPVVYLIRPTTHEWINSLDNVYFTFKIIDPSFATTNCTLYINGIRNQFNNTVQTNTTTNFTVSGLTDGMYQNWSVNTTNPGLITANNTVIFHVDATMPEVDFVNPTPTDNLVTNNRNHSINITIDELHLKNITYSWNGTTYNMFNKSLVAMFNFDNRTILGEDETNVYDMTGNGYNGTWNGNYDADSGQTIGKHHNAFMFDGTSDYIELENSGISGSNPLSLNDSFTINFWYYPRASASQYLINNHQGTGAYNGHSILIHSDPYNAGVDIRLHIDDDVTPTTINAPIELDLNKWHHITCVRDKGNRAYIYVNSVEVISANDITGGSVLSDQNWCIGRRASAAGEWSDSIIDEVMFWNDSMTADEVSQLYKTQLTRINNTFWNLNATYTNLSYGTYNYSVCAGDLASNENCTGLKNLHIAKGTVWQVIDNTYNGVIFNLSSWKIIDSTYNGEIYNISAGGIEINNITASANKRHCVDWINISTDCTNTTYVFLNITCPDTTILSINITQNNTGENYWCNRTFDNGVAPGGVPYGWPAYGNGTYSYIIYAINDTGSAESVAGTFILYPNADATMNNITNAGDLTQIISGNWGSAGASRQWVEDVNGNGVVNAADLTYIIDTRNWGWAGGV